MIMAAALLFLSGPTLKYAQKRIGNDIMSGYEEIRKAVEELKKKAGITEEQWQALSSNFKAEFTTEALMEGVETASTKYANVIKGFGKPQPKAQAGAKERDPGIEIKEAFADIKAKAGITEAEWNAINPELKDALLKSAVEKGAKAAVDEFAEAFRKIKQPAKAAEAKAAPAKRALPESVYAIKQEPLIKTTGIAKRLAAERQEKIRVLDAERASRFPDKRRVAELEKGLRNVVTMELQVLNAELGGAEMELKRRQEAGEAVSREEMEQVEAKARETGALKALLEGKAPARKAAETAAKKAASEKAAKKKKRKGVFF
jgi:hypothetical protein